MATHDDRDRDQSQQEQPAIQQAAPSTVEPLPPKPLFKTKKYHVYWRRNTKNIFKAIKIETRRKPIGRDWLDSTVIRTPIGRKLELLQRIDDGHKGIVFKARGKHGKLYALKVPKTERKRFLEHLHKEEQRNRKLSEFGIKHAKILEFGEDYVVKEWIEGIRGDVWFKNWREQGCNVQDLLFQKLMSLWDGLAARRIYVQNMKALNMIYDGADWVAVDVGYIKTTMTEQEVLERYHSTFDRRWHKKSQCQPLWQLLARPPPTTLPTDEERKEKKRKKKEKRRQQELAEAAPAAGGVTVPMVSEEGAAGSSETTSDPIPSSADTKKRKKKKRKNKVTAPIPSSAQ